MRSVGMNASENSIHDRKRIDRDQKKSVASKRDKQ